MTALLRVRLAGTFVLSWLSSKWHLSWFGILNQYLDTSLPSCLFYREIGHNAETDSTVLSHFTKL